MSYIRNVFVVKKCLKGSKLLSHSQSSVSHYLLSTTHGPFQDLPLNSRASHQIALTCSVEHGNKVTWVSQLYSKMSIVLFNILGILYTNTYFFNKKPPPLSFVAIRQG